MTGKQKQSCQNDVSLRLDRAIVKVHLGKQLAFPTLRVSETEVEPLRRAFERLLKDHIDEFRLSKNSTEGRDPLVWWLLDFGRYLDLYLPPSKRDLYDELLQYLAAALSDLDKRLVRPVLKPASTPGRPSDGYIEANFKVRCVLAADEEYNSARLPGKKRPQISRPEADERILRRVKIAATALGLSMDKGTIDGWRRAIKKPSANKQIKTGYRTLKDIVDGFCVDGSARNSKFIVAWLLDRMTDPDYVA